MLFLIIVNFVVGCRREQYMHSRSIDDVWSEFWTWTQAHPAGVYLFRGQADASPIVPKIGRPAYNFDRVRERVLFESFERAARPFFRGHMNPFELLALAQHHGAPTRLVDWSTTPMVAAWFAVSSYPENEDAQVYALDPTRADLDRIDTKTGATDGGPDIDHPLKPRKDVYLVETAQISNRITTQRGIFTLHGDPTSALVVPTGETFSIPAAIRNDFQSRLMDLGVDAAHIFPDIDGLCRSLDWRLKTNKMLSAFA
jgi:FRG domain